LHLTTSIFIDLILVVVAVAVCPGRMSGADQLVQKQSKEPQEERIVKDICAEIFGLSCLQIQDVGSCQDQNYRISAAASPETLTSDHTTPSPQRYVLKIFHPNTTENDLHSFLNILLYLSSRSPQSQSQSPLLSSISTPLPQLTKTGNYFDRILFEGTERFVCLLTYLEGIPLSCFQYYSQSFLKQYGRLIASVCQALVNYQPTTVPRGATQWDMRLVLTELSRLHPLLTSLSSSEMSLLTETITLASPVINLHREALREQVIHGDLATYNLIARAGSQSLGQYQPEIIGIIDFGDSGVSWTVSELVISILSSLWHLDSSDDCFLQTLRITEEFHTLFPLARAELGCVWPLLLLRSAHILCSVSYELQLNPRNEYNRQQMPMEWRVFRLIRQVNLEVAMAALEGLLTHDQSLPPELSRSSPQSQSAAPSPLFSVPSDTQVDPLDLTVESPLFIEGNWLAGTSLCDRIRVHLANASSSSVTVSRYGETKFHSTSIPSSVQPSTTSLFSDIYLPIGTQIFAPFLCSFRYDPDRKVILLRGESGTSLLLRGIKVLDHLLAWDQRMKLGNGECLGSIAPDPYPSDSPSSVLFPPRLSVQLCSLCDLESSPPPFFCTPEMFPHWSRLCPSPNLYLPPPFRSAPPLPSSLQSRDEALGLRSDFVASVQEHYYRHPPRMVRGWQEFLYDETGRGYLDMVNNVTVLGHCHPAIASAATRQLQLLNTNSRFLYRELGELAQLIVATLPSGTKLNKVLFVNSGSEATDLALRIARTVVSASRQSHRDQGLSPTYPRPPGDGLHRDTICLEGAYHGITTASDEVSTTLNDNPIALESRPPWIHLVPMPNKYRGKFLGEGSLERYVKAVEDKIATLAEAGTPVSVFIAEPLSGNAGGVELPAGYLKEVYDAVHAAGGLCISDEVQVGYGRLGKTFWGHEEHPGVVPDIVTMAKAAGNGYPLGFVITTEEIVEKFRMVGSFFSSAGGGPLSCAIGKTVLQTLLQENLTKNAFEIGAHLRSSLEELALEHPDHVGCVHGHGLYQGIEIIERGAGRSEGRGGLAAPPGTQKAALLCEHLLELGVICHNTGDHSNVLKVKPPLCISLASANFFLASLRSALRRLDH
jgi:4-aminobutyrate aminotransferase-like enzyme/Ser/Thr protein kinase RdoA (MazF antagonist)